MEEFESYRQTVKAWQAFERRMLIGIRPDSAINGNFHFSG